MFSQELRHRFDGTFDVFVRNVPEHSACEHEVGRYRSRKRIGDRRVASDDLDPVKTASRCSHACRRRKTKIQLDQSRLHALGISMFGEDAEQVQTFPGTQAQDLKFVIGA